MATARQTVEIIDEVLHLEGTARLYADHLRGAGMLPRSQGHPIQLEPEYIALILLSCLLGEPSKRDTHERVAAYAALRPASGFGPTLGDMLAGFVERPFDLFELRLDLGSPFASMVVRQADRGMATLVFASPESRIAPVERTATLTGGTLTTISAAIANAPEIRAGRRRRHRKN